jgi:hypothetical protein
MAPKRISGMPVHGVIADVDCISAGTATSRPQSSAAFVGGASHLSHQRARWRSNRYIGTRSSSPVFAGIRLYWRCCIYLLKAVNSL